jgi:hypothetical protein
MNIHLQIERVIVSGALMEIGGADLMQKAVETELARLLHAERPSFTVSSMRRNISGGSIFPTSGRDARGWGHQIAHGIYHGIRNAE